MKVTFLLFAAITLCACGGGLSDEVVDLGQGFMLYHEGTTSNVIVHDSYASGQAFIPCNVARYSYNDDYIVALQEPQRECFFDTSCYEYKSGYAVCYYWIVDKKDKRFYGPLSEQEFNWQFSKLKLPATLRKM
ncbi:MAG: DUF3997 domain-containing protein [Bacteroidota bacterium]